MMGPSSMAAKIVFFFTCLASEGLVGTTFKFMGVTNDGILMLRLLQTVVACSHISELICRYDYSYVRGQL